MWRSERRSDGTSSAAWTTTPIVVPMPSRTRALWWVSMVDRLGWGTRTRNQTSTAITTRLLAMGTNMGAANLPRVFNSAVNRAIRP